ncbi:MAG: phosphate ABC transporter permease [Syntrophobacteraceae bacterium CG2_30_61_12]|nr:MAG: phosphate ABC transporter permease [Syntrophobacteraceae bacterium CG2_30_61_12]PIU32909.1 MAG: phosphate ABC transporter permease [Syntrophobacteraceae bacterium CG07_land_8_20_14_0_80_61_8]
MNVRERFTRGLLRAATLICASATAGILLFMLVLAVPLIASTGFRQLLFGNWAPLAGHYGILPMIAASALLTATAWGLSFPISLGCAALICELAPRRSAIWLHRMIQMMTGIPTVVYGFVGVFLLVPVIRETFAAGSGRCLLTATLVLALMITPTMVLFFVDALEAVPTGYRLAAAAAGADPIERLLWVIIPGARSGIVAGSLLAFGRALGDTLIALMLAGNAAQWPEGLLQSARTLTAHIALVIAADFESPEFRSIFLCGIVLYAITSATAMVAWRLRQRSSGGPR